MITENIPVNLEGLDGANIRRTYNPGGQLEWSSFENTGLSSSGYYFTIATLYSDAFVEDQATYNTHLWEVEEGHYHDNIKFTNAPRVTYRKNKTYKFRYVVFPFRYDETVTTWFGTGTVQVLIEDLRAFYPGDPPPVGTLNHVLGDAGLAEGAATLSSSKFHRLRRQSALWRRYFQTERPWDGRSILMHPPRQ